VLTFQKINGDTIDAIDEINRADSIAKEQLISVESTSDIFNEMSAQIEDMISNIQIITTHFGEIAVDTNTISDKIQEIATVANESAALTESVTATSEEQRASMEEIGSTVGYLQDLSEKLQKTVDKFQI